MASAPRDDSPGAGGLRVITLASACTPMPLQVPFLHELEGFTVFRSHAGEGDALLYYLHVGYFAGDSQARDALEVIRRHYPFATIEAAPRAGMGSLEDTMTSGFEVLRRASPRVVPNRPRPSMAQKPRKPAQHYAVLLARRFACDLAAPIPRLPVFRNFSVYSVQASDDSGDCLDIRLGFFRTPEMARHFAESIRAHFPQAAALPVSEREHARVSAAHALSPGTAPAIADMSFRGQPASR